VSAFTPPTVEEVRAYCAEKGFPDFAEEFHDHHETRGWYPKGSTRKMVDWQAAVRTWNRFQSKFAQRDAEKNPLPTRPELKPAPQPTVSILPLEAMEAPRTFKGQSVEQELLALGSPGYPADIPTEKK